MQKFQGVEGGGVGASFSLLTPSVCELHTKFCGSLTAIGFGVT